MNGKSIYKNMSKHDKMYTQKMFMKSSRQAKVLFTLNILLVIGVLIFAILSLFSLWQFMINGFQITVMHSIALICFNISSVSSILLSLFRVNKLYKYIEKTELTNK